jgi:cbb3-type cytochrome oxidase cytochrome c subunit
MRRPPDLSKVGADPEHSVEWLMAHVRSPKTHNPESTMPPYDENKINDNDLRALAEFLASLKGDEGGEAKEGGTTEGESTEAEGNASP